MANDKTYDRHINIWINGKEVKNDISSIRKEMLQLTNQTAKTTRGTEEYYQKIEELKRLRAILKEHQETVAGTKGAWDKIKGSFSSAQGILLAGLGGLTAAYESFKGVINSTDQLGDKFERTIGGWRGGFEALERALATISNGGLANLGKKIREGIEEGRRYADALDSIDEATRALMMREAKEEVELNRLRIARNDVTKSDEERKKAADQVIIKEEQLAKLRTTISETAFQNESQNIAKITGLTKEEVLSYALQEEQMMKDIALGQQYNDLMNERTELNKKAATSRGQLDGADKKRFKELELAINNTSDETKRFAAAALLIPGPEKMNKLRDSYIGLWGAIGSAEANVKDYSKQASLSAATQKADEKDLAEVTKEAAKKRINSYELLQAKLKETADELEKWYQKIQLPDTDKEVESIRSRQLEDLANQLDMSSIGDPLAKFGDTVRDENEVRRRQEIADAEKTGASIALINEKYEKLEFQRKQGLHDAELGLAADFMGNIATIFGKQTAIGKAAAVAETTINTYRSATAAYASLAGIPVVGPALGAVAAGAAIAAGLINVKKIVSTKTPEFAEGGMTPPGAKYKPVGIVHAGEWIANQAMVTSPATGPIIKALEHYRVSGSLPGYANGGGPNSISTAGGNQTMGGLGITDPKLTSALLQLVAINKQLLQEGVNMKFGYREADNVRRGIQKIDDIERNVTR
jgi:hypothetical protein